VIAITHPRPRWLTVLNTRGHRAALTVFVVVVLAHWAEHVAQAIQIWVLGSPVPESRGVLGEWFPWVVSSEALHYGYALVMLAGLIALRPGFVGEARTWWNVALALQIWHHVEHLLLLTQAHTDRHLLGRPVPTSIAQLVFPRVELHLFYNVIVFVPMMVAITLHRHPRPGSRPVAACNCALAPARHTPGDAPR
jgi:hypothetical protein